MSRRTRKQDRRRRHMKQHKAFKIIQDALRSGKIFSVVFDKRTTGDVRRMLCRGRVRYTAKGTKPYDPRKHSLVVVYDMERQGWRSIPLDAILQIKTSGVTYYA